ncbi:YbfB/YjiJ family MFS transporter [Bosea sp. Root483D1]|uniref:YbfB/YjiJ family MFS transporter n=1 Tax=Bosea sp. Root483D1 TaxID=1736544 RepID=UPI001FCCF6A3|nr:YbfB/YjiJ family MFS transporter [Bosea sp. Root483D1]
MSVAMLALAPAIALGFARFAYALILPDMSADLGWSYADAGLMNTANAAGYLMGALLAARAINLAGSYRVMAVGVWACIAALAICAVFRQALPLNAARLLAGFGGGLAFVAGSVLATGIAQRNPARAVFLLGLFYAGPGLGILLSGLVVPIILERLGPGSWKMAWAALSILSVPLAIIRHFARSESAAVHSPKSHKLNNGEMKWLLCGYLFFGAGYIAYMTFMIAWVQGNGGGAGFQALFWAAVGVAAMASPWLWAGILKRQLHGRSFAVLTAITMIGAALPLLPGGVPVLLASAALFGSAFFAVVAATTAFVRRNLPQEQWASGIGMLTVVFGIGQMLGPIAIGFLNDQMRGLAGGLWASVVLLGMATLIGLPQRDFATVANQEPSVE